MSRNISANHVEYSKEAVNEKKSGDGKMIFTKIAGKDCAALVKGGRLLALQTMTDEKERIGAFYIAKIRKVVPNLNACFVEISGGEICFLPLREARRFFRCSQVVNRKNNALCQGDEILIQIVREAQKNKQATVTAHISLTNEAAVIGLGSNKVGYSSKFSKEEKTHFKNLLEENGFVNSGVFTVPESMSVEIKSYLSETVAETGMVVRTLAAQLDDASFLEACKRLLSEFFELLTTARHRICFSCVKESAPVFVSLISKLAYASEYNEIVTDDPSLFESLTAYEAENVLGKKVRLYQDDMLSLEKLYSLDTKVEEALQEKVWLKSGAYLVIQQTEAMTVIDVNSGKKEAAGEKKDYYFQINKEAAEEIAIQLRLRNLSGIIIVDFINMSEDSEKEELLDFLRKGVSNDKVTCSVIDMTPLGLVELTRKKDLKPLREEMKRN